MAHAVEDMRAQGRAGESCDDPSAWSRLSLRPTGLVVFAAMDGPPHVYGNHGSWPLHTGGNDAGGPYGSDMRDDHSLRRLAGRSAAWLLGR